MKFKNFKDEAEAQEEENMDKFDKIEQHLKYLNQHVSWSKNSPRLPPTILDRFLSMDQETKNKGLNMIENVKTMLNEGVVGAHEVNCTTKAGLKKNQFNLILANLPEDVKLDEYFFGQSEFIGKQH